MKTPQQPHNPVSPPNREGFSYVAVLLLVVLMSAMGLSFIQEVSLEAAANQKRRDSIQAEYLARAAVNHAMYMLVTDTTFPKQADEYYMHTLDDGRYGYMVTRHTATTFATVATIGIYGNAVAKRCYVLGIDYKAIESLLKKVTK